MIKYLCVIAAVLISTSADAKTSIEASAASSAKSKQVTAIVVHSNHTDVGTFDFDAKATKSNRNPAVWHLLLDHMYSNGVFVVDDGVRYDQDKVATKVGVGFGWWDMNATVGIQVESYDSKRDKFLRASVRSRHDVGLFETFGSLEYLKRSGEQRIDYRSYCRVLFGSLFIGARAERVGGVSFQGVSIGAVFF